jgi:hypothetical protein
MLLLEKDIDGTAGLYVHHSTVNYWQMNVHSSNAKKRYLNIRSFLKRTTGYDSLIGSIR